MEYLHKSVNMPNILCEGCQRFDIQAFGRDPFPYRGVHLTDVIRSSRSCSFCNLLLEHLQKSNKWVKIGKITDSCDKFDRSRSPLKYLYSWHISPVRLWEHSWVNFSINRRTTSEDNTRRGLDIASMDVSLGAFCRGDGDPDRFKFHVAADPGNHIL